MSPTACAILINQVMPILSAVIPRMKVVGSDDAEEMLQDATASAAAMLESAERAGKPLLARSTAYYCIQRCKVGRKSTSASRNDVLGPGSQLDGHVIVVPMDELVTTGDEESTLTLGEMLTDRNNDDASLIAGRNLDWQAFLDGQDDRASEAVFSVAEGQSGTSLAERWHVTPARVSQKKREIAKALQSEWGGNILQDIQSRPLWAETLNVTREKAMSRYEVQ
jgi:hypothetical protein